MGLQSGDCSQGTAVQLKLGETLKPYSLHSIPALAGYPIKKPLVSYI